jgi:hypothetical protein
MKEDLRQRFVEHPGELGEEREAIIRSFLKAYLPKRFEISTGFVFDCEGNVSNQIDIVIADSLVCPLIETVGGKRYYPCESVVAVGQVKSSVTSNTELRSALDNLESVKRLDRSAKGTALDSRHGEQIDHIEDHLHQLFSFLFITGRAISENTIQEKMLDYIVGREAHLWPNALIAIDQYLVTFCCDDGVCPNPMHARGIAIQRQQENIDLVMRFFLLLGRAIEVIRVSGLPYWEYLYSASKWDASVVYAATDDPPPYLCSL